jgi:hypothetical protein
LPLPLPYVRARANDVAAVPELGWEPQPVEKSFRKAARFIKSDAGG